MPELSSGRFVYGSSKPPPHDEVAERRREAALRTIRPDPVPRKSWEVAIAEAQSKPRQPEPQKVEDHPMTEQDAMMLAKANDACRVRRDYINAHPELSKISSVYAELMPATTDRAQLDQAATQVMQKYRTEFLPLAQAHAAKEAVAQDAARREKMKADLIANGQSEALATAAAALKFPGDLGYGDELAPLNAEVTKQLSQQITR